MGLIETFKSGTPKVPGIPVEILWFIALALAATYVLLRTSAGNWIFATGGDSNAAKNSGVPVTRVKISLFMLTDNRGYGCINRLQTMGCGGEPFNNMYVDCNIEAQPEIDYVAHAASMGAHAVKASGTDALEAEIKAARARNIPTVIVIDTIAKDFPGTGLETSAGEHGYFWDVAVPEVSDREKQRNRYAEYITQIAKQTGVN